MAPSSPLWDCMQMGVLTARGVVVGLDPHDREDNLNAVARCCNLVGLVVNEPAALKRFAADVRERLRLVVCLQPTDEHGVMDLDRLLRGVDAVDAAWPATQPDDPATIIFTSGTTGAPKGIQYTQQQLCQAAAAILEVFPDIGADDRLACWLPLSNLFQRVINLCAIGSGAQTYYVEDPRAIMSHLGTIAPHIFIGVPRFYEKLHAGMMAKIGQAPSWQQRLVAWALRSGEQYAAARRMGRTPGLIASARYALADRLALRRLRNVMGSNLRFLVSGSAPMPSWLLERFHAMGLLILEAYGLSENIIPIAMNRPSAYRFGTVGRVLRGNAVRLAEDGELWVRGPGVFSGYYGEAHEAERFDADGYLASGDYATMDADGFITLTGRKSEIFKTSTGRRIAPAGIESLLRQIPYVEHAAVFGAGRPFLVAVLAVTEATWQARTRSLDPARQCECLRHDLVPIFAALTDYQRPAGVVLTTRVLSIERGELTPNLKLRRSQIEGAFRESIDALYERLRDRHARAVSMTTNDASVLLCPLA